MTAFLKFSMTSIISVSSISLGVSDWSLSALTALAETGCVPLKTLEFVILPAWKSWMNALVLFF